jgi:hypothetical protein
MPRLNDMLQCRRRLSTLQVSQQSLGRNRLSRAKPHPGGHAVPVGDHPTCQNFCAEVSPRLALFGGALV